jgi:hypothetical protein
MSRPQVVQGRGAPGVIAVMRGCGSMNLSGALEVATVAVLALGLVLFTLRTDTYPTAFVVFIVVVLALSARILGRARPALVLGQAPVVPDHVHGRRSDRPGHGPAPPRHERAPPWSPARVPLLMSLSARSARPRRSTPPQHAARRTDLGNDYRAIRPSKPSHQTKSQVHSRKPRQRSQQGRTDARRQNPAELREP